MRIYSRIPIGASERSSVWLGELKAGETRSVSWNVTATDSAALKSGAVQVKVRGEGGSAGGREKNGREQHRNESAFVFF